MKGLLFLTALILSSKACFGQIYADKKEFIYGIEYIQSKNLLKTKETIRLAITGKKWKNDENQVEAIWIYKTKPKTRSKFQDQFSIGWFSTDTTGIIENEKKIWIHPPRHNQYTLTEIAPFPDFRKN